MSKKERSKRPAAFLSLLLLRPPSAWKIYLQQWMLPDMQSGFCLEVFTKSKFFGQKLSDLGSVQNKLMQLKRVTRSVARGGSSPENSPLKGIWEPKLWRTCRCLDQNSEVFWLWSSPSVSEDLFFVEITCFRLEKPYEFLILAGKTLWILAKTFLFFWRLPEFGRKTASILFKTNENLRQVRLRLYQTSKKAPHFAKSWLRACVAQTEA